MGDLEANHRAAVTVLARIETGEPLRLLVGDGRCEPASEIVLTKVAAVALKQFISRGLALETGNGGPDPEPASPALPATGTDDGVTGD